MTDSLPPVSILVCTRNRGQSLVPTVRTILANAYPAFELIIVDQSTNDETANALEPFLSDPRLHLLRTQTNGLGRARNQALAAACHELALFTDDDCEVPTDWIARMAGIFQEHPNVAVVFCNVVAAPCDLSQGFIPIYERKGDLLLKRVAERGPNCGIGAGMAVRRTVALQLGGFDEMLGAGALFSAYEDGDIAVRALLKGYEVFETDRTAVLHFGFRTMDEGRALTIRNYYGIGGAFAKYLKCRQWSACPVITSTVWLFVAKPCLESLMRFRKPPVLRRVVGLVKGFVQAWRTPVDREKVTFRVSSPG